MKIKHVYGNVLKLDIPLTIKIRTMEGDVPTEREEPFYPDVSKGCVVVLNNNYNRKMEYNASLGGNVAHIEDDGVIGIGTYKVTVKCYDEYGNPYRYMVRDIIEICDATIDAGIEAGVEFNAETYTLEGAVFVSYGGGSFEQVQADWAEADIHSKAYIKNKPNLTQYATKEELSEVEGEIPTLPDHIVTDENYVHTDNNYTTIEKEKLAELENYDDSGIRQELDGKVDKVNGKGLSTNDFTDEDKSKLDSALQSETDPTVPSWAKQSQKPTYTAQEVGALPNSTKYGSTIDLTMNSTTYVLTLSLKDQDGTVLNTKTVDLPIESVVVSGRYDATNKKIVLTLQSGSTIDVPIGDLIAGLQTEITSVNMLDADLVDDTNSTHKFVTTREKQAWNNKSDFSGSYNDLTDKPTIPTALSQLSQDAMHRVVSDTEKSTWNGKQDAIDDLADIRSGAALGATALQSFKETDPTVPSWAKASTKPTYTASEVGALPDTTVIPAAQVNSDWNANSGVAQILNKPTIPTVPTTLSSFTDDLGNNPAHTHSQYLTSAPVSSVDGQTGAVVTRVQQIVNETNVTITLNTNVFYSFGTLTSLTVTLGNTVSGMTNEYAFEFDSGNTATTLSIPATVIGIDATAIKANKHYEVSIKYDVSNQNYYGLIQEW